MDRTVLLLCVLEFWVFLFGGRVLFWEWGRCFGLVGGGERTGLLAGWKWNCVLMTRGQIRPEMWGKFCFVSFHFGAGGDWGLTKVIVWVKIR